MLKNRILLIIGLSSAVTYILLSQLNSNATKEMGLGNKTVAEPTFSEKKEKTKTITKPSPVTPRFKQVSQKTSLDKDNSSLDTLAKDLIALEPDDFDTREHLAYEILSINPDHLGAQIELALISINRDKEYLHGMETLSEIIIANSFDQAIVEEYSSAAFYAGNEGEAIKFLMDYRDQNPEHEEFINEKIEVLNHSRLNNDNAVEIEEEILHVL